jgi:hypothetical protein
MLGTLRVRSYFDDAMDQLGVQMVLVSPIITLIEKL